MPAARGRPTLHARPAPRARSTRAPRRRRGDRSHRPAGPVARRARDPVAADRRNGDAGTQEARIAYVLNQDSLRKAVICLGEALKVYPGRVEVGSTETAAHN